MPSILDMFFLSVCTSSVNKAPKIYIGRDRLCLVREFVRACAWESALSVSGGLFLPGSLPGSLRSSSASVGRS